MHGALALKNLTFGQPIKCGLVNVPSLNGIAKTLIKRGILAMRKCHEYQRCIKCILAINLINRR